MEIGDVGEHVPYARKHTAEKTGKRTQDGVTLKNLWPEPDWRELIDSGRDPRTIAYLAMVYEGLAKKPRMKTRKLPDEKWADGYIKAIEIIKQLFDETITLDQAKELNERLLQKIGLNTDKLKKCSVEDALIFWAAGRGSRTLYSPANLTFRQQMMAQWMCEMGWPESKAVLNSALFPLEMKSGQWCAARIEGNRYVWDETRYPTSDAAIQSILKMAEKEESGDAIPVRPNGVDLTRTGPDYREGRTITPEVIAQEFGFRAIQFGNSVSQSERSEWMCEIYDALADFADIMGMNRRWIGFNGQLALAVGARGKGGISHSAHFETGLQVINLTRGSGAGSFAHEWGHGLDNRLLTTLFPHLSEYRYLSSLNGPHTAQDLHVIPDQRKKHIYEEFQKILSFCRWNDDVERSEYRKGAEKIKDARGAGNYWTLNEEMLARAFESYIQDALAEKGVTSPWLVHGTLESDYDQSLIAGMPYPVDIEREILNCHFSKLIGLLGAK